MQIPAISEDTIIFPNVRRTKNGDIFKEYCSVPSFHQYNIDGLVQNFSNSIVNALELLQSCIKPSI